MKAKQLNCETIAELGVIDRKFPIFRVGDTIAISQRIKEAGKERLQVFEGNVIKIRRNGISSTFTVRKIGANAIGVERIFPFFTAMIDSIALIKTGRVRRAKLYYLRKRVGRSARIQEKLESHHAAPTPSTSSAA